MRQILPAILVVVCLLASFPTIPSLAEAAVAYQLTVMGSLSYSDSYPYDINNAGQVVGAVSNASTTSSYSGLRGHAFLYESGVMTDLNTLPDGRYSFATGINATGVIVGESGLPLPPTQQQMRDYYHHAFIYSRGVMTDLGGLSDTFPNSSAVAINDVGQIAGNGDDGFINPTTHEAFLYANESKTPIKPLPGYANSIATAINTTGHVVGYVATEMRQKAIVRTSAFLYRDGQTIDLGTLPGFSNSSAYAINASDEIVGAIYTNTNRTHAFLYRDGIMRDLGTLSGFTDSFATDINASGQVVGTVSVYHDTTLLQHAFLYSHGSMIDLNTQIPPDTGWVLTQASGINDVEQIICIGVHQGLVRSVLLTPVHSIAIRFASYYSHMDGLRLLGNPLSNEMTVNGYSAQYFEKGRLEDHQGESSDPNWRFMYGLLVDELQQAKANEPIGGDTSTLTYADLNALANPGKRVAPPAGYPGSGTYPVTGAVFVPFTTNLDGGPGHYVLGGFWEYIQRKDLFPGGWLHDVGLPIMEPQVVVVTKNFPTGPVQRQIIVQAFQRTILTYDPANPADWQIERANVGTDYRLTFHDRVGP